jgi:hypothetical protein
MHIFHSLPRERRAAEAFLATVKENFRDGYGEDGCGRKVVRSCAHIKM